MRYRRQILLQPPVEPEPDYESTPHLSLFPGLTPKIISSKKMTLFNEANCSGLEMLGNFVLSLYQSAQGRRYDQKIRCKPVIQYRHIPCHTMRNSSA